MILRIKKYLVFLSLIFALLILFSANNDLLFAQTETSTQAPSICSSITECADQKLTCDQCATYLQNKISQKKGEEKTLFSQIAVMDSQIRLTQLRINTTKQQILSLSEDIETTTKKISSLEDSLKNLMKALLKRIVATYEVGSVQPLHTLLSSNSVSDFFSRANYLRIVQAHDKRLIYETQQAKNDYANQKEIFEGKKKKIEDLKRQLESYTVKLDQEKKGKQQLLEVTRNDEQRYQKLLQEAEAQIQAFKSFATSRGGPSILPAQPSPDGWYYNQRDERWGSNTIGNSSEQVWDVGCLVTATTMVMKKHGSNVTPQDVASNASYYFSDTAYMLLPWAGGKFSSVWGFDQGTVDEKLSSGEPVIVGVRAGAYGMHFVVLKSESDGDYVMNDPWYGPDLKFSDYYSTPQIFQYGFYNG